MKHLMPMCIYLKRLFRYLGPCQCLGLILAVLMCSTTIAQVPSSGEQSRQSIAIKEFLTACTFGVLAGTLVGTASLAFEKDPGGNLRNIAKGASIGLYGGILLGLYLVYIVPGQIEKERLKIYEQQGVGSIKEGMNRFHLFPLISQNGLEGVAASWKVVTF